MAQAGDDVSVSWAHPIGTRDGTLTADAKMVNAFAEKEEAGGAAVKRPGSVYVSSITTGTAQGQFSYLGTGYFIVNDTAYQAFSAGGGGISIPLGGGTAGLAYTSVNLQEYGTGVTVTVIQNESGALWTFNGSVFTRVTDANYTSQSNAFGIAYLDGVFYVIRVDGQLIGSAINDPTTWPALDYVQADIQYGQGISVSRHLNYILGFYDQGLQVFWDANAAPNGSGIALQPVLSASYRTGLVNARTIAEIGDNTFFLAHTTQYGRSVQMFNGLTLGSVSTPYVEKILNNPLITSNPGNNNVWGFGIDIVGHQFYVLTLVPLNVTLVYDVTMQMWGTWSSVVGGVEQYFVGRFYQSYGNVTGGGSGDVLQDVSTGRQIAMDTTAYTDATGNINVTLVTPPYDWGTLNYKRFAAMFQIADTIADSVNVSFSDDDYQSFSTPRALSLQYPRKQLRNCGSSRRRAWMLQYSGNNPLRVNELKIPIAVLTR